MHVCYLKRIIYVLRLYTGKGMESLCKLYGNRDDGTAAAVDFYCGQ